MKHTISSLPYEKSALEPFLSRETIEYHYGKHHQGYVDKLNSLIPGTEFEDMPLTEIVTKSTGAIFHNAAQAWNHEFYWNSLTPEGRTPQDELLYAIEKSFDKYHHFNDEFRKAAEGVFGSGWVWLVKTAAGDIIIETTSNADNPMTKGNTPLLVVDVWEHAYYIDYRNERSNYLERLEKIMNWEFAERNFRGNIN